MRKLFKVSTKAAIFDPSHENIIIIDMDEINDCGLPGGHVDEDETPDEAIMRELFEECGIIPDTISRKDFFIHSNGKLILAYTGEVSDTKLKSEQDNLEGKPVWMTKSEFMKISIEPNYREFVLNNWPK